MKLNDKQLEALLLEFKPRAPRPFPLPAWEAHWKRRLAAAAVVIVAGSASLWLAMMRSNETQRPVVSRAPGPQPEPAPSLLALTRMAQDAPRKLDATLDAESRGTLPGFQEKGSALAALAKE